MTARIAPAADSLGLGLIGDWHQRPREGERRPAPGPRQKGAPSAIPTKATVNAEPAPSPSPDASLPADTLFAVSMLANQLAPNGQDIAALMACLSDEWSPPPSSLHLKDKSV